MKISEHAEKNRIMPPGSIYPGKLCLDRSPYLREIMNNMSPDSDIKRTIVMKGCRVGVKMAAESVMCYYIKQLPVSQVWLSDSSASLRHMLERRLKPALRSYEYLKLIQEAKRPSRYSIKYPGGDFDLFLTDDIRKFKIFPKQILIRETSGGELKFPEELLAISDEKTQKFGNNARILYFGIPGKSEDDVLYQYYKCGDQRQYFVPCPHCDKFQPLKWRNYEGITEAGVLVDAGYKCDFCRNMFFEFSKKVFFEKARWEPTAHSIDKNTRSYHLPAWLSALRIHPWLSIYNQFLQTKEKPDMRQMFVNVYMGLPYHEKIFN